MLITQEPEAAVPQCLTIITWHSVSIWDWFWWQLWLLFLHRSGCEAALQLRALRFRFL